MMNKKVEFFLIFFFTVIIPIFIIFKFGFSSLLFITILMPKLDVVIPGIIYYINYLLSFFKAVNEVGYVLEVNVKYESIYNKLPQADQVYDIALIDDDYNYFIDAKYQLEAENITAISDPTSIIIIS